MVKDGLFMKGEGSDIFKYSLTSFVVNNFLQVCTALKHLYSLIDLLFDYCFINQKCANCYRRHPPSNHDV